MITRAQAEALLTLAEALEACERQGVTLAVDKVAPGVTIAYGANWGHPLGHDFTPVAIRLALSELVPKSTGS